MKQFLLLLFCASLLMGCQNEPVASLHVVEGETMGTYYRISYIGEEQSNLKATLDSALLAINLQVSTYIDSSTISRFNQSDSGIVLADFETHFLNNFQIARDIYTATNGAYDPTVMPLVNYWGFGYKGEAPITATDSSTVDSILQYIGFDERVVLEESAPRFLRKTAPGVQLDFSATAKGYGVELLGLMLQDRGLEAYFVDIGGEVLARGLKPDEQPWTVGINTPSEDAALNDIEIAFPLADRAIATSGNYRNYVDIEGEKYGHTINPSTGFPERNRLLSASVFAPDCATADGFATACMVLGDSACFDLIGRQPTIDLYLIVGSSDGSMEARFTAPLSSLVEQAQN